MQTRSTNTSPQRYVEGRALTRGDPRSTRSGLAGHPSARGARSFAWWLASLAMAGLGLSGCLGLANRAPLASAIVRARDLPYVDDGHAKHRLHAFAPRNAHGAPVVVFVHGGYWRSGDRSLAEPITGLYSNVGEALADQGVVAFVPSYRLFPEVERVWPMLDDVAAAIHEARRRAPEFGGDPERLFLMGHSAGAHLVTLLVSRPEHMRERALSPEWFRGVIALSGIYDVNASAARAHPPHMKHTLWDPLFGDESEKARASPLPGLMAAPHPPIFFVVGGRDYPNCMRDFGSARAQLGSRPDHKDSFRRIEALAHEAMILRVGASNDVITPSVMEFIAAHGGDP